MELLLKTKIIFMYLIYPDYEMDDFDFLNFLFCAQLVGQVSRPDRNLLRGETYVIEVPKDGNVLLLCILAMMNL